MKTEPRERHSLGIESTADDFSVGISTFNGQILANIADAFIPKEGGIHPREAARHHAEIANSVIKQALQNARLKPSELTIISFAQGPGLGPCLRTGATVARALAAYLDLPLVGVNHCLAHIEIGRLKTEANDPLTLYVSGGNTLVSAFEDGRYRIFGETLDIALGNCLDVFAREAGLHQKAGEPFGAVIEKLARSGDRLISLPYAVKGMDTSFSGLLTAATEILRSGKNRLEDICYSLQETAFSMLTEVAERGLAHTEKKQMLLTGGVASNQRLQSMINIMAKEHDARFFMLPLEFAVDNGAMIAWTGALAYTNGISTPIEKSYVKPRWRLEEVDAPWMQQATHD
jgi:N6-L-threonylcarbamoyladenine synthase/protein kinase Bud32